MPASSAFLFDLDGTLVDTAYHHAMAWREALVGTGLDQDVWRIHRRIGMSGDQIVTAMAQEAGRDLSPAEITALEQRHAAAYARSRTRLRATAGARELLAALTERRVPWTIATSSTEADAHPALELLGVPEAVPIVLRDDVAQTKPAPDLFLAAAERLGVPMADAVVVGDSTWDLIAARRGGARSIGLLCGGYGREELQRAGAFGVFADPAELLRHLDNLELQPAA